ncbi:unnamed protein product, partial [Urochloa humidicola]
GSRPVGQLPHRSPVVGAASPLALGFLIVSGSPALRRSFPTASPHPHAMSSDEVQPPILPTVESQSVQNSSSADLSQSKITKAKTDPAWEYCVEVIDGGKKKICCCFCSTLVGGGDFQKRTNISCSRLQR